MTHLHPHAASETAILFATPPWETPAAPLLDALTPLDPLLGRSPLQRAVEHLVRLGARNIMVVIDENATAVRNFLQTGERWGCRVTYHYPDPHAPMGRFLGALGITPRQYFWMGNAWSIPAELPTSFAAARGAGTTLHWQDTGETHWTGWGCFSGAWLISRKQPSQLTPLAEDIENDEWLHKTLTSSPILAKTPDTLLASARQMLAVDEEAISKAAQVRIHPTASLIAPCHIGKGTHIGAGAIIGPYAVIEGGAYVSEGAHVSHSIVMPETYIGAELDLQSAIARGSLLVNAALGSRTEVSDPELLAHLYPAPHGARWSSRAIAGFLQCALLPIYLLLRRRRNDRPDSSDSRALIPCPGLHAGSMGSLRVALALPAAGSTNATYDWTGHFIATFYPGLGAVRRGELRFIGPSLRSWREAAKLPAEWRRLYEESPCGLLNDNWLMDPPAAQGDEAFAGDSLAAAGPETPLSIAGHVMRYLQRLWHHATRRSVASTSPSAHVNAV